MMWSSHTWTKRVLTGAFLEQVEGARLESNSGEADRASPAHCNAYPINDLQPPGCSSM